MEREDAREAPRARSAADPPLLRELPPRLLLADAVVAEEVLAAVGSCTDTVAETSTMRLRQARARSSPRFLPDRYGDPPSLEPVLRSSCDATTQARGDSFAAAPPLPVVTERAGTVDDQRRSRTLARASCRRFCRDLSSSVEFCRLSMVIEAVGTMAERGGEDGVVAAGVAAPVEAVAAEADDDWDATFQ